MPFRKVLAHLEHWTCLVMMEYTSDFRRASWSFIMSTQISNILLQDQAYMCPLEEVPTFDMRPNPVGKEMSSYQNSEEKHLVFDVHKMPKETNTFF